MTMSCIALPSYPSARLYELLGRTIIFQYLFESLPVLKPQLSTVFYLIFLHTIVIDLLLVRQSHNLPIKTNHRSVKVPYLC